MSKYTMSEETYNRILAESLEPRDEEAFKKRKQEIEASSKKVIKFS